MAFIIDTARVNARTVAVLRETGDVAANRNFAFEVVRGLVTPHILRRMAGPGIQKYVRTSAECYLGKTDGYLFTWLSFSVSDPEGSDFFLIRIPDFKTPIRLLFNLFYFILPKKYLQKNDTNLSNLFLRILIS